MTSQPLRVGIDISAVPYNRGVSRYTSNLVWQLSQSKEIDLHIFGASRGQQNDLLQFVSALSLQERSTILPLPAKVMEIVWNRFSVLPVEKILGNIDVFHAWESLPPQRFAKQVVTIHDLAMIRFPETADPYIYAVHKRLWNRIKKQQAMVIAVSESTKKDIVEFLQIDPENVVVVHEALPVEAQQHASTAQKKELRHRLSLKKPFLFFLGTTEPRKNLPRLIQAWEKLKHDYDLVIAGASGWEAIRPQDGLHVVGAVSHADAAALYESCEAFVYPSLYEGFGLPVLEAFFHRAPVVTSNLSSLPEVAGKAAVLVHPLDVQSIEKGIQEALHRGKEHRNKGMEQLKKFSWEKTTKETIRVYKKALEEPKTSVDVDVQKK